MSKGTHGSKVVRRKLLFSLKNACTEKDDFPILILQPCHRDSYIDVQIKVTHTYIQQFSGYLYPPPPNLTEIRASVRHFIVRHSGGVTNKTQQKTTPPRQKKSFLGEGH